MQTVTADKLAAQLIRAERALTNQALAHLHARYMPAYELSIVDGIASVVACDCHDLRWSVEDCEMDWATGVISCPLPDLYSLSATR